MLAAVCKAFRSDTHARTQKHDNGPQNAEIDASDGAAGAKCFKLLFLDGLRSNRRPELLRLPARPYSNHLPKSVLTGDGVRNLGTRVLVFSS